MSPGKIPSPVPIFLVVYCCNFVRRSYYGDLVDLIRKTKLIIWDEAPMVNRNCFETLERTMADIWRRDDGTHSYNIFGGKFVLFGGDSKQTLPVIPCGSRQDAEHASINSSHLWKNYIGDGKLRGRNDGEVVVEYLEYMLILDFDNHVASIVEETYPDLLPNLWNSTFFKERAILAPTHDLDDVVNKQMLTMIPEEEKTYYSSDTISASDANTSFAEPVYTTNFLNNMNIN
ncbi:ATP-dependent DNA helicase PIF1-like protein [Tanacetum coccineum]